MNIKTGNKTMFYGADSKTFEAARILRKNMTLAERILWKKLRDKRVFSVKFRRQHPVGFFILDFYCHEYKLGIEVDGEIHQGNVSKEYDLERTAELEKFGIKVLRFSNDQIYSDVTLVITEIQERITKYTTFRGAGGVRSLGRSRLPSVQQESPEHYNFTLLQGGQGGFVQQAGVVSPQRAVEFSSRGNSSPDFFSVSSSISNTFVF